MKHLGLSRIFGPCCKNVINILATPLGSQAAKTREIMYPKTQNQQKDYVSHTNLSFQEKPYDALSCKRSIMKLSLKKFYP